MHVVRKRQAAVRLCKRRHPQLSIECAAMIAADTKVVSPVPWASRGMARRGSTGEFPGTVRCGVITGRAEA
jgi:hypothetical protein